MISEDSIDLFFKALAHQHRRAILDILMQMPGCSVNDVCKYFRICRIVVMKHLDVLEKANLIVSKKVGRQRELYFNAIPIQMMYDRWTDAYSQFWAGRVMDIQYRVENARRSNGRTTDTRLSNNHSSSD